MAISTICRWETGRVDMMALGLTLTPRVSKISLVRFFISLSLTMMPIFLG